MTDKLTQQELALLEQLLQRAIAHDQLIHFVDDGRADKGVLINTPEALSVGMNGNVVQITCAAQKFKFSEPCAFPHFSVHEFEFDAYLHNSWLEQMDNSIFGLVKTAQGVLPKSVLLRMIGTIYDVIGMPKREGNVFDFYHEMDEAFYQSHVLMAIDLHRTVGRTLIFDTEILDREMGCTFLEKLANGSFKPHAVIKGHRMLMEDSLGKPFANIKIEVSLEPETDFSESEVAMMAYHYDSKNEGFFEKIAPPLN